MVTDVSNYVDGRFESVEDRDEVMARLISGPQYKHCLQTALSQSGTQENIEKKLVKEIEEKWDAILT